ncbi:acetylaminoadipate kinase, partial [Helicobacter pylori]|nr:acetylaminoadipate kinase [Helicobacter pylori]
AVFLTDVVAVLRDPKDPATRYARLTRGEVREPIAPGIVSGGMIPKVEAALGALDQGAPWAAIARGERGVLQGVRSGQAGTRVVL